MVMSLENLIKYKVISRMFKLVYLAAVYSFLVSQIYKEKKQGQRWEKRTFGSKQGASNNSKIRKTSKI